MCRTRELSCEQICKTLDELASYNYTSLKITGGEPFLRKDLLQILRHAKSCGFAFDVSTNASRIDTTQAKQLAEINPEFIHVSLDGHNATTHEQARGAGSFTPTLRGLHELCTAGVRVRVGAVVFTGNQDAIFETKEEAIKQIYSRLDKDICSSCEQRIFLECKQ